jgi:hypothetical protein
MPATRVFQRQAPPVVPLQVLMLVPVPGPFTAAVGAVQILASLGKRAEVLQRARSPRTLDTHI